MLEISCIKQLINSLSDEGERCLKLLLEIEGMNRTETQNQTGYTYALTGKVLLELEHKLFVYSSKEGRNTVYYLTENGYKAVKILLK